MMTRSTLTQRAPSLQSSPQRLTEHSANFNPFCEQPPPGLVLRRFPSAPTFLDIAASAVDEMPCAPGVRTKAAATFCIPSAQVIRVDNYLATAITAATPSRPRPTWTWASWRTLDRDQSAESLAREVKGSHMNSEGYTFS